MLRPIEAERARQGYSLYICFVQNSDHVADGVFVQSSISATALRVLVCKSTCTHTHAFSTVRVANDPQTVSLNLFCTLPHTSSRGHALYLKSAPVLVGSMLGQVGSSRLKLASSWPQDRSISLYVGSGWPQDAQNVSQRSPKWPNMAPT